MVMRTSVPRGIARAEPCFPWSTATTTGVLRR